MKKTFKEIIKGIFKELPFGIYWTSCLVTRVFVYITVVTVLQSGFVALVMLPQLIGSRNFHQICRLLKQKTNGR